MDLKVPLFETTFGTEEEEAVRAPVRDGWLTMGTRTEEFEQVFAQATGARHVIAVNSCTAALHLALVACGVGPGDEVLCPTLTFVATANAARYIGARVVFCESVGVNNLLIDPDDVAARITPRTRALMVVHFAGYPADLPRLTALCRQHNLALIEDAAHACITDLQGQACGTWGDCGCFSFFSNKNITCGEGGALTTQDDRLAERLRLLRAHGMTTSTLDRHQGRAHTYDVVDIGYNYRLDEIRSNLLLAQMNRLDGFMEQRRRHVLTYRELLADGPVTVPDFDWARLSRPSDRLAPHIFPVVLPPGTDRGRVMDTMRARGVQTSVHYPPMHKFRSFRESHPGLSLPRTEDLAARELTLPLFPSMTREQIRLVCTSLREALHT
jgi:dTDP-4-amino-4,6-dideoxygalactose transaminase